MGVFARAAAILAFGLFPLMGQAQGNPVVVELYTSQGCSSCPPADAILAELATRSDVIALALHVDYWDYIGWKDEFADPRFTRRQHQYAVAAGARTVYTPQFIVGGVSPVVGAHAMELAEAVAIHAAQPTPVVLTLRRDGARLHIVATAARGGQGRAVVQLVRYVPERTVSIERGENAGKSISYANIVTDWRPIGPWAGTGDFEADVTLDGPAKAVVIVQEDGFGRILAAARAD